MRIERPLSSRYCRVEVGAGHRYCGYCDITKRQLAISEYCVWSGSLEWTFFRSVSSFISRFRFCCFAGRGWYCLTGSLWHRQTTAKHEGYWPVLLYCLLLSLLTGLEVLQLQIYSSSSFAGIVPYGSSRIIILQMYRTMQKVDEGMWVSSCADKIGCTQRTSKLDWLPDRVGSWART